MEANPEEIVSKAEHEKAPKDAAVETGKALDKHHNGWHLAVGRSGQRKEKNLRNCGSQMPETAAATRKQEHLQQYCQAEFHIGDRETSSQDVQQIAEREGLDTVEGSAPSAVEEQLTRSFRVRRVGNVGTTATLDSFAPTV
jgi:hypothetical protein